MLGRVMRTLPEKTLAIVLDHVGNCALHGPVTRRLAYDLGPHAFAA